MIVLVSVVRHIDLLALGGADGCSAEEQVATSTFRVSSDAPSTFIIIDHDTGRIYTCGLCPEARL
jgi:hypothetical protein